MKEPSHIYTRLWTLRWKMFLNRVWIERLQGRCQIDCRSCSISKQTSRQTSKLSVCAICQVAEYMLELCLSQLIILLYFITNSPISLLFSVWAFDILYTGEFERQSCFRIHFIIIDIFQLSYNPPVYKSHNKHYYKNHK